MRDLIYQTVIGNIRVSFLQASPNVVPYSPTMLVILVVLNWLFTLVHASHQLMTSPWKVAFYTALSLCIFLGLGYQLYRYRGFDERFVKSFTVLMGNEILLKLIEQVLMIMSPKVDQTLIGIIALLAIWGFTVQTYILKNALELNNWQALGNVLLLHCIRVLPLLSLIEKGN